MSVAAKKEANEIADGLFLLVLILGTLYACFWTTSYIFAAVSHLMVYEGSSINVIHEVFMKHVLASKYTDWKQKWDWFTQAKYWLVFKPVIFPGLLYMGSLLIAQIIKKRTYWLYIWCLGLGIYALHMLGLYFVDISNQRFTNIQVFYAQILAVLGTRVINIEGIYQWLVKSNKSLKGKNRETHGSATFMKPKDAKKIINDTHSGLILDGVNARLSEEASFQNCLICAPTGVGKTQTFILPNILGQKSQSIVVTDPSGELHTKTRAYLEYQGYHVMVLDPYQKNPDYYFNPLREIKTISDSKRIAKILTAQVESSSDPYWHIAAGSYLNSMILVCRDFALHYKDDKYFSFETLKENILLEREELEALFCGEILKKETIMECKASLTASTELLSSVKSIALSAIELFSDEQYKKITSQHTLKVETLRAKKTALFISVPEHKIKYSAPFLGLFYSHLFDRLLDSPEGQAVYIYLEEFANIGKIPSFANIITTSRKRRLSISLIIQDVEQIERTYKGELSTISSGGCLTKVFYSSLSSKSAQFAAELCGKKNQDTQSLSTQTQALESNLTESETARNLLNPDEIRRINDNEAIVVHGNKQPIKIQITPAWKQKNIQKKIMVLSR